MFFKELRLTINQAKKHDPSAPSKLTILLSYPGIHALMYYRVARFFYKLRLTGLARILSNIGRTFTNIDIHPGATIGKGLFIDHGAGVVIGQTAMIGDNCVMFHGVTLGSNSTNSKGNRHPILGNRVTIYANATLVGPVKIGDDSIIGASAFVKQDLPDKSVVVGNPMRFISIDGKRVYDSTCECEIMKQELAQMKERLEELQKQMASKTETTI